METSGQVKFLIIFYIGEWSRSNGKSRYICQEIVLINNRVDFVGLIPSKLQSTEVQNKYKDLGDVQNTVYR